MKMQNIFILYAMALFGLGRGLCSEWRRGDCKSVGAPAFVQSELRNRKAKPLITALFSAPALPAYCLFVVLRDSRQEPPPAMHNESMTPLRSRDGPGSLQVSLPNYMGVCRTRTDADTRQLSRMLKGLQGVIREQRWSSGPIPVEQR